MLVRVRVRNFCKEKNKNNTMSKRLLSINEFPDGPILIEDVVRYLCTLLVEMNCDDGYRVLHGLMLTSKSNLKLIEPDFSKAIALYYPGHTKREICFGCARYLLFLSKNGM